MTVYLDVLFLLNGVMDFLMLSLLSTIFGYHGTIIKRVLASVIGSLLACISFILWPHQRGIGQMMVSFIISAIMLLIVYENYDLRGFFKRFFCLYLIVYGFGGALTWILKETKGGYYLLLLMRTTSIRNLYFKSFLLISIGVFCLLFLLFGIGSMAKEEQQFLYPVTIVIGEKTVHTMGLLDTGNRLREPRTNKAVLVVEFECIHQALQKEVALWIARYFAMINEGKNQNGEEDGGKGTETPKEIVWIPFSSVGKKAGKLPAILCDHIMIAKKPMIAKKEVFLAITNQRLSPTREYSLLLHTDLWKQVENK